jgi:hypothetical protein
MTNTLKKISSVLLVLFALNAFGQLSPIIHADKKDRLNMYVKKSGPYIGIQRGKYTVMELGVERQWKRIQLSTARTHGIHLGFNYNFGKNVLGYDIGYWVKPTRVGLTYGLNFVMRTDFDRTKVGFVPVIGYQFSLLHLQTGYHFLAPSNKGFNMETNSYFVSLRVVLINNRKTEVKKGNKKLFKDRNN